MVKAPQKWPSARMKKELPNNYTTLKKPAGNIVAALLVDLIPKVREQLVTGWERGREEAVETDLERVSNFPRHLIHDVLLAVIFLRVVEDEIHISDPVCGQPADKVFKHE